MILPTVLSARSQKQQLYMLGWVWQPAMTGVNLQSEKDREMILLPALQSKLRGPQNAERHDAAVADYVKCLAL